MSPIPDPDTPEEAVKKQPKTTAGTASRLSNADVPAGTYAGDASHYPGSAGNPDAAGTMPPGSPTPATGRASQATQDALAAKAKADEADALVADETARTQSVYDAVCDSYGHFLGELEALASQIGQGKAVTGAQLAAVQVMAKSIHKTLTGLASGSVS